MLQNIFVATRDGGPQQRSLGPLSFSMLSCRVLSCAVALIATTGCTTNRFTEVTAQFGKLTHETAEQQNKRLMRVVSDEREAYRQSLAASKLDLRFTDCARTLADSPPDPEPGPPEVLPRCRVKERVSASTFRELQNDVQFENVTALNTALTSYAEGLVLLAADNAKDRKAFAGSVTNLASSIGELDGAVRKATDNSDAEAGAKLNAIGALVAEMGNLYFEARRRAVLERLVIEGDPVVQRAVAILGDADAQLDLYNRAPLYQAIVTAQEGADNARISGDVAKIRASQDNLFAAVAKFNGYQRDRTRFAAIGKAHSKLATAARSGATLRELQEAMVAVLGLASTMGETEAALNTEKQ